MAASEQQTMFLAQQSAAFLLALQRKKFCAVSQYPNSAPRDPCCQAGRAPNFGIRVLDHLRFMMIPSSKPKPNAIPTD